MRCLSCDKRLNNRESTRKYSSNGSFVDLCDRCYSYVADDIAAVDGEGYVENIDMGDDATDESFETSGFGITGLEEGYDEDSR